MSTNCDSRSKNHSLGVCLLLCASPGGAMVRENDLVCTMPNKFNRRTLLQGFCAGSVSFVGACSRGPSQQESPKGVRNDETDIDSGPVTKPISTAMRITDLRAYQPA